MVTDNSSRPEGTNFLPIDGEATDARALESLNANSAIYSIFASSQGYAVVKHSQVRGRFSVLAGPFPPGTLVASTWVLIYAGQLALRGLPTRNVTNEILVVTDRMKQKSLTGKALANAIGDAISRRVRPQMSAAAALNETRLGRRLIFKADKSPQPLRMPVPRGSRHKTRRYAGGPKTPTAPRSIKATAEAIRAIAVKMRLVERGQMLDRLKQPDRPPGGRKVSARDLPPVSRYGDDI